MSQQTDRQRARRTALEQAKSRCRDRAARDRVEALVVRVMAALGERDAHVARTERASGAALRELVEVEGLTWNEVAGDGARAWCALDQVPGGAEFYSMARLVALLVQAGLHPREWDTLRAHLIDRNTRPATHPRATQHPGVDPPGVDPGDRRGPRAR